MADKYVELKGGMDVQTPPIAVEAGTCRDAVNVYESVNGGYTTIKGYERLDGGVLPSETEWYRYRATRTSGTVGASGSLPISSAGSNAGEFNSVVNGTLRLRGDIINVSDDGTGDEVSFVMSNPYWTLAGDNELISRDGNYVSTPFSVTNIDASGATQDTYDVTSIVLSGPPTEDWDTYTSASATTDAVSFRSQDTRQPRGDGDILGVHQVLGSTMAWREDTANNTNILSVITRTTAAKNWQAAKLAKVVVVDTTVSGGDDPLLAIGTPDAVLDNGYTIQDGRVTSVADTVVYLLLIYTDTAQPDIPDLTVLTSGSKSYGTTAVGAFVDFAVQQGGRMESINHNFYAGVDTNRAYFADGVNPAMYYDPVTTALVPIMTSYSSFTPSEVTSPNHLVAFQSRLIISTNGGGFITSVGGNPMVIDGILGSIEIGVGEYVTGFKKASANELLIFTTGSTWSLSGNDPETNWTLRQVTGDSGAKPQCIVDMGDVFAADDVGIVNVKRSDVLGGFTSSTVTNNIQRLYGGYDKSVSCSTVIKGLEQMRFFFGTNGLIGTRIAYQSKNGNDAVRFGFTRVEYPHPVITIHTDRLPNGVEQTVFGSDTGYIYKMDSGTSFDNGSITAGFTTAYNHVNAPWQKKRFEGIALETVSTSSSSITISQNNNDGERTYADKSFDIEPPAAFGQFSVQSGAVEISKNNVRLRGSGYNVQLTFSRTSSYEPQVSFTGYTLRYTPRGLVSI